MGSALLSACLAFAKISVFCFGGGYAALGLIQSEIVEKFSWLSMEEYLDMVAIAEMTPGPIAVNAATFVGNRLAGPLGGIACTLSFIFFPVLISFILAVCFMKVKDNKYVQIAVKGIRPVAIAIIAAAAISMGRKSFVDWWSLAIFAVAAVIIFGFKKNPIFAILVSGAVGIVLYGFILV